MQSPKLTAKAQPVIFPLAGRRVLVAGGSGMVGSALARRLAQSGCTTLAPGRGAADLRRQAETEALFKKLKPDAVFVAAATAGGILANSQRPAEFLYDNLMIAGNVIEAARQAGVKKLLYLGSSCVYPLTEGPIREDRLLAGPLEPTNEWYAVAKIAGLKLCAAYRRQWQCDYIAAQPTNLYGPGDKYDLQASHVIPALIMKIHRAKKDNAASVEIWGSGRPRREFLHVDDLADALVFLMERYSGDSHVNIGWGEDMTIKELAALIAEAVGYKGGFKFDASKPDGAKQKLLDTGKLDAMGWRPRIRLKDGLADAYAWFVKNAT